MPKDETKQERARAWCFTFNNPTTPWEPIFQSIYHQHAIRYQIAQKEQGKEGTPHIQGYINFNNPVRFTTVKKLIPGAHWEIAQGTPEHNQAYCSKEEGRLEGPWEFGKIPRGQGQRMDLDKLKEDLDEGKSLTQIRENHFTAYLRYSRAILDYRLMTAKPRDWEMSIIVLWGPTGSGKSRYCHETYPGAYWKTKNSGQMQFWDGYSGEETIIVDEFYGWMSWDFMLRFTDRYPCHLEVKHGTVPIAAKTIVFTSNKHPREWYPNVKYGWDEHNPLKRRISEIREITRSDLPPVSTSNSTIDNSEENRLINLYLQK